MPGSRSDPPTSERMASRRVQRSVDIHELVRTEEHASEACPRRLAQMLQACVRFPLRRRTREEQPERAIDVLPPHPRAELLRLLVDERIVEHEERLDRRRR